MNTTIGVKNNNIAINFGNNVKKERNNKGKNLIDFPDEYIVFDIETTGLDSKFDEIIEIGAIKVKNGEVINTFNSLIKPQQEINEFITALTGITNEMVADAPNIEEVLPQFLNYICHDILIGHNVNFDINFVYDWSLFLGLSPLTNNFIDTMRIGRRLLPELGHHRLIDLAKNFKVDIEGNHRALKDVYITNDVYINLRKLVAERYSTVENFKEEIKKISKGLRASDITTNNTEFDESNILFDKNVAITGTLEKMQRKEAMQIIADLGGHCQDGVNKETNYLVLGNNDYNSILKGKKSNKLIKAENLKLKGQDIEILSENVFYDIIGDYINDDK